ncbi:MAG TPA: M20/M25/M40 family metallo-hydrolase, partial [Chryseosolibacter sp.]|nr:M20/M25/M40 family metallo-hydrolase [Chryseosolibacter sp.]
MKHRLILVLAITISQLAAGQKLTKQEKAIIASVDKNMATCVALLEKTVNINSGTLNTKGVEEVGRILQKEFDAIGMTTSWITMPDSMKRGGHLFAEQKGKRGKRLLLIGHLDTVFEPYSPFQKYVLQDTIAYGPGTNDMKSGNLVILFALRALYEARLLKDIQVIVALHGDEENAGDPKEVSRRDIIAAAKRSDVALAFETGTGFGSATVARRGSSSWTIAVRGKQAHSSGIFTPGVGAGAVYEAARILNRFYQELQEPYLTFNAGLIAGGTSASIDSSGTEGTVSGKTNIVPNATFIKGDLRFLSEQQKEAARTKMRAIVAASLPQTSSTITFEDGIPSMPPTEGNMKLLGIYSQVSLDLGLGEVKPYD